MQESNGSWQINEKCQDILGCIKAWVQNLMEVGIKNLVYMVFSPLP